MSLIVVYLASPRISGHLKWTRLDCISASLALLNKYSPEPLPVLLFHEDYTEEDKSRLLVANPNVTFEQVDFAQRPEYVHVVKNGRVGTSGYQMMCRFFCGIAQRHPLIQKHTHYMRLDDDSYIVAPIKPEILGRLCSHALSYNSRADENYQDLWGFALDFAAKKGLSTNASYSPHSVYTNFHVCSLELWNHPIVAEFMEEAAHRCLTSGWTDSTVAMVLAKVFCPALGFSVNFEREFYYRHNQQCIHNGIPHTVHCTDGYHSQGQFQWGPPATI